jgi:hypothetical protein
MLSSEAVADDPSPPGQIVLWSSKGPLAVARGGQITSSDAGHPDAETLLRELLKGPTAQEREAGLRTAIPEGTTLAGLGVEPDGKVTVQLKMPPDVLRDLSHSSFEVIVEQVGQSLTPLKWRDLRIQVEDPRTGAWVALAGFLPEIPPPRKESTSLDAGAEIAAAPAGQPPAEGQGQPLGGLTGKTIYVSAGHGWQWTYSPITGSGRWETQRPSYPGPPYPGAIIEDHNNAEAVNQYLLRYLWNAGAMVWPVRERDMNGDEAVVDVDLPAAGTAYEQHGTWTTSGATSTGYAGTDYRYAVTVGGGPTASATWRASLPTDGRYGVYAWYRPGSNRAPDARYIVHHAGGETEVVVDQTRHGDTWHFLGAYGFLAGEEARVTLTNESSVGGLAVIADAVRFGGGTFDDLTGIDTAAEYAPNKPWWEVATFYYVQKMGMDAATSDVVARPIYSRWEHAGTGDDAVYVSWHTNGYNGTLRGTESYAHNGTGEPRTEGSLGLRRAIHSEIVHDIRAGWELSWTDRGEKLSNLGELRELWDDDPSARMPGALIEIAFHDNPDDTDALKDPRFNMLVARAMYQGIVKYFEQRDGIELTLLPEPPTHLAVENLGDGGLRVSWAPSPTDDDDLVGDVPTGYRVYTSNNGIGWSDGVLVGGATETTLAGLPEDEVVYVRVTAFNQGGESFPTETLAARVGDRTGILLVNGFDRLDNAMLIGEDDPVEGYNERMLLGRMNSYDYVIQHAQSIPYPFDSACNEAVQDGQVSLADYRLLDWILGRESYRDDTLNDREQALLRDYLDGGGALFISGEEIGWDHHIVVSDREFYRSYLRADYYGDDAETYDVTPVAGSIFEGLDDFHFRAAGMYEAEYPDQLGTSHGSTEALSYVGGREGTAAVQYAEGCHRVVTFGFPFETIDPDHRFAVMERVLDFLDECLEAAPEAVIESPEDGSAHSTPPPFTGRAHEYGGGLQRVDVQIERESTGEYWTGSAWRSDPISVAAEGTTSWSYALPALADAQYHLRARACGDTHCDPSPAEVDFIFDTVPPAATSGLITPTGGVTITAVAVDFSWHSVGADGGSDLGYRIKLDDDVYTTTQASYTVCPVEAGLHQWGVQVFDMAGNNSEWVTDRFQVRQEHFWLPLTLRAGS